MNNVKLELPQQDFDEIMLRSFAEMQNKTIAAVYHKMRGQIVTQRNLARAFGKRQATISEIIKRHAPKEEEASK